jgi:phosphatidylglycerol:prolipoprotein diacylglycerol transferase
VLPFVFFDESRMGPLHAYGIACALGFFAWDWAVMRQAARRGLDLVDFRVLVVAACVVGAFVAWLVDAVFYHPAGRSVTSTLLSLQGFSSTGGIVGAVLAGLVWRRVWLGREDGRLRLRLRRAPAPLLAASDVVVSTWPLGWAFGRLGCALIHDHPGVVVAKGTLSSLFAVGWPSGPEDGVHHMLGPLHVVTGASSARFDLGLLECLVLFAIAAFFARTWHRERRPGYYVIVGALVYGPTRFALDFLRAEGGPGGDLRHFGLTFAQYFCLAIVALAIVLLFRAPARRSGEPVC